jgi:hypothetical protein
MNGDYGASGDHEFVEALSWASMITAAAGLFPPVAVAAGVTSPVTGVVSYILSEAGVGTIARAPSR